MQRLDLRVEAEKPEAPVLLQSRHGLQRPLGLLEAAALVGVLARDADEPAARVEGPRVIEALEGLRRALVVAADDRAAVGAGVVEGADGRVGVAEKEDLLGGEGDEAEIAEVGELFLAGTAGTPSREMVVIIGRHFHAFWSIPLRR